MSISNDCTFYTHLKPLGFNIGEGLCVSYMIWGLLKGGEYRPSIINRKNVCDSIEDRHASVTK